MSPNLSEVLDFMTFCFDTKNLGYSALNTVRSALSTFIQIDGVPVGSHYMITRFMKGVYACKPALPRNNVTWDTSVVLHYLKSLSPVKKLDIKELTMKSVTLTALLTGQRCQSLTLMDIRNIDCTTSGVKFRFGDILKQTRPGFQLSELHVKAFAPDRRLCLATVLSEYMDRVESYRGTVTHLFVTTKKPFKPASGQTISRWIKMTLASAGIDMAVFTPHSVRSASTSNAKVSHIPLATILKTAGWSNAGTFARYYNKPIDSAKTYSEVLLNNAMDSESQ